MADPECPHIELANVLLSTTSVEEVVARAPQAIARALAPDCACNVEIFEDAGGVTSTEGWLCIPLRLREQLFGAITIDRSTSSPECNERNTEIVAGMLATALESRMRAEREHAAVLADANTLKLDAISMLSHEMRTPLASIKGYATALLLDDADWDEHTRREFLQIIDEESDRLSRLIQGILESASIDANAMRIDPEPILIPHIARRVVERIAFQSPSHQFDVSFPDDFPIIEADAGRIEQVLTNLVDNAVKYSPEGGLTTVRGEVLDDDVVVSVTDQGTGISPEDLDRLFDRFFRASSGRRRVSGTGLGLPISSSIVRAHGGRIWAESTVGEGTTLAFTLPRSRVVR